MRWLRYCSLHLARCGYAIENRVQLSRDIMRWLVDGKRLLRPLDSKQFVGLWHGVDCETVETATGVAIWAANPNPVYRCRHFEITARAYNLTLRRSRHCRR